MKRYDTSMSHLESACSEGTDENFFQNCQRQFWKKFSSVPSLQADSSQLSGWSKKFGMTHRIVTSIFVSLVECPLMAETPAVSTFDHHS